MSADEALAEVEAAVDALTLGLYEAAWAAEDLASLLASLFGDVAA